MTWNYQIVKFTDKDEEGCPFAKERNGAPLYGLFEIFRNDDDTIHSRTSRPEMIYDTFGEEQTDPVIAFTQMLEMMLHDVKQYPILEEPYDYAPMKGDMTIVDDENDEDVEDVVPCSLDERTNTRG